MMVDEAARERFFRKVEVTSHCWEWTGSKTDRGYGKIIVEKKQCKAHRVSWVIYNGEIPNDLHVCHHCDNPGCVNPVHLFLGTNNDNIQDKVKKGRHIYRYTDEIVKLLGMKPDSEIAEMIGTNRLAVKAQRMRRRIPCFWKRKTAGRLT